MTEQEHENNRRCLLALKWKDQKRWYAQTPMADQVEEVAHAVIEGKKNLGEIPVLPTTRGVVGPGRWVVTNGLMVWEED